MATLPDSYSARPATEDDLDGVARSIDAADRALGVAPEPIREELLWRWRLRTIDLDRDTRVVMDGGEVVAYAHAIYKPEEGGPLELFARVHPRHRGEGLGTWLASWGELVARERGARGVRAQIVNRDASAHTLLRARNYVKVRSSFMMSRMLDRRERRAAPPVDVTIRSYADADERVLFDVLDASFAEHWGVHDQSFESFTEELHGEDWDPSLVFLADADGRAVGAVVSFDFEMCGYVAMLGVVKEWRGRGIATALLRRSFAELRRRGKAEVRLNVDTQNADGAVALYERAGMAVSRTDDVYDLATAEAAAVRGTDAIRAT
jgi:mycothiol synthase